MTSLQQSEKFISMQQLIKANRPINILLNYHASRIWHLSEIVKQFLHELNSFWQANSHSVSWEIKRSSWNSKVHYRVHKTPPVGPVLLQMNPVHTLTSYYYKIHFNITLPFLNSSSKWRLPFGVSDQTFVHISLSCVLHGTPTSFSLIWSP
jgi:hypothetical protein